MPRTRIPDQKYSPRVYAWQVDQLPKDEDTLHDELMTAFYNYYKANMFWTQMGTKRSAQDARYWLNEIKLLTVRQRLIILSWLKVIKTHPDRCYKPVSKKQRDELEKIFDTKLPGDNYGDDK